MQFQILLFSVSLVLTSATLSIIQPESLIQQFQTNLDQYKDKGIPYKVANFGHIPWGKRLTGNLILADPLNSCTDLVEMTREDTSASGPIFLIKKDDCHYVVKARNALRAGASMAIIEEENMEHNIMMADDGTGDSVTIPTIFLSPQNWNLFLDSKNSEEQITLVIDFDVFKFEKPLVHFWVDITSTSWMVFAREFSEFKPILGDSVYYEICFQFFQCGSCKNEEGYFVDNKNPNCLGSGRYCMLDPDGGDVATGADIVQEQLRQLCVYNTFGIDKFLEYSKHFQDICPKPQLYTLCSATVLVLAGIEEEELKRCVSNSWSEKGKTDGMNSLLEQQLQMQKDSGITFWPSVSIENIKYKWAYDAGDIVEYICATLVTPTEGCERIMAYEEKEMKIPEDKPNVGLIVGVVIVILVLFFFFMVFVYRKMVRNEINKGMDNQVNQIVSQYVQFYENRNKGQNV